jgi:hypothetical protein
MDGSAHDRATGGHAEGGLADEDGDDLRTHPLHTGPDDPPPPRREQLPLPRRTQQAHLEPQLRTPGSGGSGTPFTAFTPAIPGQRPTPERDTAVAFRDGSQQARRRTRRPRRPAD